MFASSLKIEIWSSVRSRLRGLGGGMGRERLRSRTIRGRWQYLELWFPSSSFHLFLLLLDFLKGRLTLTGGMWASHVKLTRLSLTGEFVACEQHHPPKIDTQLDSQFFSSLLSSPFHFILNLIHSQSHFKILSPIHHHHQQSTTTRTNSQEEEDNQPNVLIEDRQDLQDLQTLPFREDHPV